MLTNSSARRRPAYYRLRPLRPAVRRLCTRAQARLEAESVKACMVKYDGSDDLTSRAG